MKQYKIKKNNKDYHIFAKDEIAAVEKLKQSMGMKESVEDSRTVKATELKAGDKIIVDGTIKGDIVLEVLRVDKYPNNVYTRVRENIDGRDVEYNMHINPARVYKLADKSVFSPETMNSVQEGIEKDYSSMRKRISEMRDSKYSFKLDKKKNEYGEYTVKCYKDGKYDEAGTYYTEDYEDALGTLKDLAKRSNLVVKQQGSVVVADSATGLYNVVNKNGEKVAQGGNFESKEEAEMFAAQYGEPDLQVVRDAGTSQEELAQKQYEQLKAERKEIEDEIDENDNNPNYNIMKAHNELYRIDKKIEELKKKFGYSIKDYDPVAVHAVQKKINELNERIERIEKSAGGKETWESKYLKKQLAEYKENLEIARKQSPEFYGPTRDAKCKDNDWGTLDPFIPHQNTKTFFNEKEAIGFAKSLGKEYGIKSKRDKFNQNQFIVCWDSAIRDGQTIKVTLDGKTYNAVYRGKSTKYSDMADVYIDELLNYYGAKKTPKDDLGFTPNDGKYYISIDRIKKENPNVILDSRCRDEYFTKREKEDKEFVKNALAEMRRYISNWQFMSLKERNDIGVSLSELKARVKELENVSINDDFGSETRTIKTKLWNPDFYLVKEPNYNEVKEGIRNALKNSGLEVAAIELSVFKSYVAYSPTSKKLDNAQLKKVLNELIKLINRNLYINKLVCSYGQFKFTIEGFEYLIDKYKIKDSCVRDDSTRQKLIELWAYIYGQSKAEAKKHIDALSDKEVEEKYKLLNQGFNSNARRSFYEDSAIKDTSTIKAEELKVGDIIYSRYDNKHPELVKCKVDKITRRNGLLNIQLSEVESGNYFKTTQVVPEATFTKDSAIRDAYYNIGGYKSKDDKMLKQDIAKAKAYGLKTYLEWVDDSYQLTVEGSYDKVKKIVEDYFGLDVSSIGDSKCNDAERYLICKDSGAGEIVYETNDLQDAIEELKALGRSYYINDTQKDIIIKYSQAIKMTDDIKDAELIIQMRKARENLPDIDSDLHWYNSRYGSLEFSKNDKYLFVKGDKSDLDKFKKEFHLNDSAIKDSKYEFDGNQFDIDELKDDAARYGLDVLWAGYGKTYFVKGRKEDIVKLLQEYNLTTEIQNIKDSAIDKPEFPALGKWEWDEVKQDWWDTKRKMYYTEIVRNSGGDFDKNPVYAYLKHKSKDSAIKDESMFMILNKDEGTYLYNVDISTAQYRLTTDANKADKFTLNEANRIINILKKYNFDNLTTSEFLDSKCKDATVIKRNKKGDIEYTLDSEGWVRAYKGGNLVKESEFNVLSSHPSNKNSGFVRYATIEEFLRNTKLFDSEIKDKLSNNELVSFAKSAERAKTEKELEEIIYEVINYDKALFRELMDAYKKDYLDFNHKRQAIANRFTLKIEDASLGQYYFVWYTSNSRDWEKAKKAAERAGVFVSQANTSKNLTFTGDKSGLEEVKKFIENYLADFTSCSDIKILDKKIKDYAPPYAVYVKKNGKWLAWGGSNSGEVDRKEFLKQGYEDVKVVKNGPESERLKQLDTNLSSVGKPMGDSAESIILEMDGNNIDFSVADMENAYVFFEGEHEKDYEKAKQFLKKKNYKFTEGVNKRGVKYLAIKE